jgi:hypothetical protein
VADITGTETRFEGPYGTAEAVPLPATPDSAESLCTWLLTAPHAHPAWSQYLMPVVRLRDGVPGFPPPKRQFPGATHELIVVALNPQRGPFTPASLVQRYMTPGGSQYGRIPYLVPGNVTHQIEGTDEDARELAAYAAWGVTAGVLLPETSGAPSLIRGEWKSSLVKTLAHIRGEAHAE